MGAGHSRAVAVPSGTAAGRHKSRLVGALALTTTFMVVEVRVRRLRSTSRYWSEGYWIFPA